MEDEVLSIDGSNQRSADGSRDTYAQAALFLLVLFTSMATGCRSLVLPGVLNHAMRLSVLKSWRRHWSALFGNEAHEFHVLTHGLSRYVLGQQICWIF